MASLLVISLSAVLCSTDRLLYQSQCVFRHGARAPVVWIIPPYDELFLDIYNAKESDLTTEGILQLKAFGSHLRSKYISTEWFNGIYNIDAPLMSISTTNTRRTHQSVQALMNGLFNEDPMQYAQIYTVPLDDDILRVDSSCLNFNAEKNFQETDSANYAQSLFNETENEELLSLWNGWDILKTRSCSDLGANCYLLLSDHYKSISFHFEDINQTIDDGVFETLQKYEDSLQELAQYDRYKPYTANAHNIGFELFNEIVNHLDCSYINILENRPCSNANDQAFEQECDAGFCGIVLYSAHDSTIRSLAHQLGILTQDNEFNLPSFAASVCFDSYKEDDGNQTVEIYYGFTEKSDSKYGYNYIQKAIGEYSDGNILNCGNTYSCSLDNILRYRDSRIPTNDGCCTIQGNSKIYFDAVGCNHYNMTTDQITELNGGYDMCTPYRSKCPSTACGDIQDGLVYVPSLEKCVAIETETEETDIETHDGLNEWFIIGVIFISAFIVVLFVLFYIAYNIYCEKDKKQKKGYSSVRGKQSKVDEATNIQTITF